MQKGGSVLQNSRRKRKLELMLFLGCSLLLMQKFPMADGKDEQKGETENSLISYVSGAEGILNKEAGHTVPVPPPEEPEPTMVPTPVPVETSVAVETGVTTFFTPECYPSLEDIIGKKYLKQDLMELDYLKEKFYIVNSTTKMTEKDFDVEYFLARDLSIEPSGEPQILIFHTHTSEGFADSRPGVTEDTVVGAGELLAQYLREKHGYNVLHDTTVFDKKDGKNNRNYAYNDALKYVEALLEEYPSIEVIIDLHRDAGAKRVVTIQGKQTAKVMLFNGLCRNSKGELSYLPNKNLEDNLAFSFQLKLFGDEMYPGLMNRIFLKDYRYNMHLAERYLLIELGTEKNTVQEAMNAMEPLSDILAQVLK